MDELPLAQLNQKLKPSTKTMWDEDILLVGRPGFWKLKAYGDGREELMTPMCVEPAVRYQKFGKAGEQLAAKLWEERQNGICSSANPSGKRKSW